MKCRPILVDDSLRELTQHGTPDFPLSMDRQVVADPDHGGVRHWHPELQIALVTEGEVMCIRDSFSTVYALSGGNVRSRRAGKFRSKVSPGTRCSGKIRPY